MLSLASCNREQLVPDGLYTITASREGDAATKTYVDDGLSLVWASEDKIGVFNGTDANIAYTLSSGDGTGSAEFSGNTQFSEGKLYAYYPYSEANKNSDAIVVDLSSQTYSSPSDFGKYFYMVGSADVEAGATDIDMGFKNPLAAFVFTVDNNLDHAIEVTGFSVSTLNSEPVFHQKATLDLTAEDPTVLKITDEAVAEISISIDGIKVEAGTELSFPVVVLPADLSSKELYFSMNYISGEETGTVNKSVSGKKISRNTFIPGAFALAETTIGGDIEGSWDGKTVSKPETDGSDANVYYIKSAAELAWVAQQVNEGNDTFKDKTLRLMNDINLNGHEWKPIGNVESYPGISFYGTFDGQGYTISNLKASDNLLKHAAAGLFGSICGTVKNLTLKDVDIRSTHYAGAVAAYSSAGGSVIENCHVDGGTITTVPEISGDSYDNGDKAGGIIGYYVVDDKVTNCSARNLTITAYRDFGGITGCGPQSGMTGCSVENITLVQDNTNGYKTEAITTVGALGGRDIQNNNKPYDGEYASAVTKKVVGNVYVSTADQLASALTSSASEISVTLTQDIDLPISSLGPQTGGSGEYKLGGESTESITIDLNGKKLNITTSYMSVIGAKNVNAVFTIRNGKMTSSQTSGTWNRYDLGFANCSYTIENVEFLKAIALVNGSSDVTITMKDVTITESLDAYAMWISALGQTVNIDGLTVNGVRGIKIDEEYVEDEAAKVTLNISNSKFTTTGGKAAIMVDSKAGAEINVSSIDISEVAADSEFAVWVDEDAKDYADKVIVNGAEVKVEGTAVISSNDELAAALSAGNSTIYLTKGEYVIPDAAKGKTVTFIGTGNPEDVIVKVVTPTGSYENCDYGLDGSYATFDGITITTNSSNYLGYARCNGTYKNCIINGQYTLYGKSTFENCEFNVSGNHYNIWTWGADEIEFTGCTFNSDGKALLLYREEGGIVNLTVKDCTFNDKEEMVFRKAAIEIGDSPYEDKPTYNVTVSDTQVNGYAINDEGINTNTTLWGNKNEMPKDRLNVTVDGVDVY